MGRIDGDDREPPVTSHDGEPPAARRPRRGRRALTALVGFLALGGFTAVVVYSYDKGREAGFSATTPLIQAQEGPTRVRPENPGGMTVPNQDKEVYGRIDPGQAEPRVERLLPPPEAVVDRPPEPKPVLPPEPPRQPSTETAPGEPVREPAPPPAEAGTPTISETPPPPPPEPERSAAAAAPEKPPAAAGAAAFRVQIASLGSEDAARRAWSRLSAEHKDLFGGLTADFVRAEVSGKGTFYRVQAGPLADASAAKALCDRAKSRKLGCLIVRP